MTELAAAVRDLAEAQLAVARSSHATGRAVFTELNNDAPDQLRACSASGVLAGRVVSVKDLFDVAGSVTRAGSVILDGALPATTDADAVRELREAGAIIVGKTNMTEFAYSGLGLNPHYGTPLNPRHTDVPRIPGGSTSGGAVSVAIGAAWAALGTDTGGSLRIPAALCGLVGWKPTARRVSTIGAFPLSRSLDSVGPIARDVASVILMDSVLAKEAAPRRRPLAGARLAVADRIVIEDMDAATAAAYDDALQRLSAAGAILVQPPLSTLDRIVASGAGPLIVAREAYDLHRDRLDTAYRCYDPRVAERIAMGGGWDEDSYRAAFATRKALIAEMDAALRGVDAWLMPTVPVEAPPLAQLAEDEAYFAMNRLMLRNPSLINFLDGCAISLPMPGTGGLSVAGSAATDTRILSLAADIEAALLD